MRGETAKRVIGLERDSREEAGAREAETKVGPVLLLAEFQPSATSRSAQATHMASNERSGAKRKEAERGRYRVGLICLSTLLDSLFSYFLFVPPPLPHLLISSSCSSCSGPRYAAGDGWTDCVEISGFIDQRSQDGIFRLAKKVWESDKCLCEWNILTYSDGFAS